MAHRNEGLDDGTTMPYLSSPREVQHISRGGRPDANNGPVEAKPVRSAAAGSLEAVLSLPLPLLPLPLPLPRLR